MKQCEINLKFQYAASILLGIAQILFAGQYIIHLPNVTHSLVKGKNGIFIRSSLKESHSCPGNPVLPMKSFSVALPPNAKSSSVRVHVSGNLEVLARGIDIAPGNPLVTLDEQGRIIEVWEDGSIPKDIRDGKNVVVYEKDQNYPGDAHSQPVVGRMRKWKHVDFEYYPYQINPAKRILHFLRAKEIVVTWQDGFSPLDPELTADRIMDDVARERFVNYARAKLWYNAGMGKASRGTDAAKTGYMIITSREILSGSDSLDRFIAHKESLGFEIYVKDADSIVAAFEGAERADRIRAYLRSAYIPLNLKYLLLIGNPWPHDKDGTVLNPGPLEGDVPMKMCYPGYRNDSVASHTIDNSPTDLYYAELTSNWDANGNGYFAEWGLLARGDSTMPKDRDSIDFSAELYVGRIPVASTDDLPKMDRLLGRVIRYANGSLDGPWTKKVLLPMKPLGQGILSWQDNNGEFIKSALPPDYSSFRIYDPDRYKPELSPCNRENVVGEWSKGYGLVAYQTHGSATMAMEVIGTNDAHKLPAAKPSFVIHGSCRPAKPDIYGSNLVKTFLFTCCIGNVGGTRNTFSSSVSSPDAAWENGKVTSVQTQFGMTEKLTRGIPAGDALLRTQWRNPVAIRKRLSNIQSVLVMNLFGDPSLRLRGANASPLLKEEIALPQPGSPNQKAFDFSITPHRAGIRLNLRLGHRGSVALSLYDGSGETVWSRGFAELSTSEMHRIDIAPRLPNGIYLLAIRSAANCATKKVLLFR